MEVYFIIVQPIGKPKKFKLQDGEYVIIGRDRNICQVPLADDMCSTKHAKVSYHNHCVYIEDMGSKNGIYLNGVKVVKQRVYKDDKIKMGDSVMYINPDKLSEEELSYLTYQGQTSRQNKGYTLELVIKSKRDSRTDISTAQLELSRKKAAEAKYKSPRKGTYVKRKEGEGKISKQKQQVLDSIAFGIDIIVSSVLFFVILYGFRVYKSDVYTKLSKEYSGLDIYLAEDMAFYTFLSFIAAAFFFVKNRATASGSLGEKVLGIG